MLWIQGALCPSFSVLQRSLGHLSLVWPSKYQTLKMTKRSYIIYYPLSIIYNLFPIIVINLILSILNHFYYIICILSYNFYLLQSVICFTIFFCCLSFNINQPIIINGNFKFIINFELSIIWHTPIIVSFCHPISIIYYPL